MKKINNYLIEKLHLDKNLNLDDDIHDRNDEITKDFRKLYKLISDEFGNYHEALDSLSAMSDFNDDYTEFYYEFDPNKWAIFLRDIVNYDWIALCADGIIDIENSNHKDIAKIMKKYNEPEIGKKVWLSFR